VKAVAGKGTVAGRKSNQFRNLIGMREIILCVICFVASSLWYYRDRDFEPFIAMMGFLSALFGFVAKGAGTYKTRSRSSYDEKFKAWQRAKWIAGFFFCLSIGLNLWLVNGEKVIRARYNWPLPIWPHALLLTLSSVFLWWLANVIEVKSTWQVVRMAYFNWFTLGWFVLWLYFLHLPS
jgi:hypothetical protein